MRVTLASIRPTEAALSQGRPSLTPELLAATGARYSRSNEGLDAILGRIDPASLDRSVDAIFRMVDYGHQSIADMAPVAIFLDGISGWLAFWVWSLCPTAGGQESSTRYIELSRRELLAPETLGIPEAARGAWQAAMERAFDHYEALHAGWHALGEQRPALLRLPAELLADASERAARQTARLRRNFAFDRARYLLPAAASTNMMLVMSARSWAALCQQLGAHPLPEPQALGAAIRRELALVTPRLLRHAEATESLRRGQHEAFEALAARARATIPAHLTDPARPADHPPTARVDVLPPPGLQVGDFARDLRQHDNRYAWIGETLRRTLVRFGWEAVAFAEIRDLNRHRTGTRHAPPLPCGFYAAQDQWPDDAPALAPRLRAAADAGRAISLQAHDRLAAGDPAHVYWTLLGTQFAFEHATTADKFIYEAELRTGRGSHFRYARHLHDALACWYARFPETRGVILEGTAEPE